MRPPVAVSAKKPIPGTVHLEIPAGGRIGPEVARIVLEPERKRWDLIRARAVQCDTWLSAANRKKVQLPNDAKAFADLVACERIRGLRPLREFEQIVISRGRCITGLEPPASLRQQRGFVPKEKLVAPPNSDVSDI